jgi:hypothetical protein
MTVIDTTTAIDALKWCSARHIDRTSTGRLWAGFNNAPTGNIEFWYSDDSGSTWTQNTSASIDGSPVAADGWSFFIDVDDHAHVVYTSSGASRYRRMASIDTSTSWATQFYVNGGYDEDYDVVAFRDGASWIAAVVTTAGANGLLSIIEAVDSSPSVKATHVFSSFGTPSIDFHHTGDGKSIAGSAPHLYVSGRMNAALYYRKMTYSGGSYSAGDLRTIDSVKTKNVGVQSLIYDGTRSVVAWGEGANVEVAERDESDTTTTTRTPPALSDYTVTNVSVTYDADQNIHLWASGATSDDLKRIVYTRSAGTWDAAWTTVFTGTLVETSLTLKRGYTGGSLDAVFLDGASSPYDVRYAGLSFESGSHVRIAAGTKAKVRDAAGTRPVVRLANGTRLS